MMVFFRRRFIHFILISICFFCIGQSDAQTANPPFIKLTEPLKENNSVSSSRQFIIGSTCKDCSLLIAGEKVKVYATGGFAFEINLREGDTAFTIVAIAPSGKSTSKRLFYTYRAPKPAEPVKEPGIERVQTFPEGDLLLQPGDQVQFRVKGYPGCTVTAMGNTTLYELPVSNSNGMPGIYQGTYTVSATDSFQHIKIPITLTDSSGKKYTKETGSYFSVMSPLASDMAITKGRLAHLEYGLGDDRLGGAKVGYIDSLIPLKITGKVGEHYRVQLAPSRTAYIPDEHVTLMPKGSFGGSSLTGKWKVHGDSVYDYVSVQLFGRLPYKSFQETDPSRIVVDVFGATNNTNWIDQLESAKEIKNVSYEQVADGIYRIFIYLKHRQHWGHTIYYNGNNLVIRVKQQPKDLSIGKLTIAVDAGHGGKNTGAGGPTGVAEKNITLALSLKIQKILEAKGTKVIMTRTKEEYFDNKERILFYRDSLPDLLLSIHLNSAFDPIRAGGTSVFYRYPGFRPLSHAIYKRMLELDLREYGNNGSFNFMLNSPTEYPNALIETLFLSNPEEEMKILDENFQQQMAEKIVSGVEDFLKAVKD
jgi:N-acetylmuramoyl-L-alanine amidase